MADQLSCLSIQGYFHHLWSHHLALLPTSTSQRPLIPRLYSVL